MIGDIQWLRAGCWLKLIGVGLWAMMMVGCTDSTQTPTVTPDDQSLIFNTSDPAFAQTLQAEVQATADWVSTQGAFATPTEEPFPTFEMEEVEGVPPNERTGSCDASDGLVVHDREGFCVAAPEAWTALNVDGGLAASLNSTPGQAISLQPDWASSTDVCNLLIYIAAESSAMDHLNTRYFTFASRENLVSLTYLAMHSLGGMAIPGFTWETVSGTTGGIYAAMLGPNRLLHISHTGTQCPREDLIPVLATLRFDA